MSKRIEFVTATPVPMNGTYNVITTIGTGTSKLQIREPGKTFQDVSSSSKSASASYIITISGEVQAVLTGDATITANKID